MSCGTSGCCLGLVLGFITSIVLAVAAAFGIYCYFTPGAREQSREIIESKWNYIKSGGDKLIEKVAEPESEEPASGPAVAPEPTLPPPVAPPPMTPPPMTPPPEPEI